MRDVMPTHADHSPVSRDLREVFHIERPTRKPLGDAARVQEAVR